MIIPCAVSIPQYDNSSSNSTLWCELQWCDRTLQMILTTTSLIPRIFTKQNYHGRCLICTVKIICSRSLPCKMISTCMQHLSTMAVENRVVVKETCVQGYREVTDREREWNVMDSYAVWAQGWKNFRFWHLKGDRRVTSPMKNMVQYEFFEIHYATCKCIDYLVITGVRKVSLQI